MAATIALVAAANGNAAAANAAAARARRTACMKYVQGYQHDGATVAEIREYADCAERLYPAPMTEGGVFGIKLLILWAFLCMGAGIAIARRDSFNDWPMAIALGASGGALASIVIGAAVAAIAFLVAA